MRQKDENKRQAISDKAIEMIVDKGLDGLSMQKLAKAAGVSPATLYIYFKDRDDLILQLCVEENKKMADVTLKNFSPDMHFEEGLKVQWMNRVEYSLHNHASMCFMDNIRHSPYYDRVLKMMDNSFKHTMAEFVKTNWKRGELVKVSVEVYWSVAFAPLYQLIKFHTEGRGRSGLEKFSLNDDILMEAFRLVIKALKP